MRFGGHRFPAGRHRRRFLVGVESCSLPTGYQISDLRRVKGKVYALGLPVDILDYLRPQRSVDGAAA